MQKQTFRPEQQHLRLAKYREMVASERVKETLQRSNRVPDESPAMLCLSRKIDIVSKSDLTFLLPGETGIGKEVP